MLGGGVVLLALLDLVPGGDGSQDPGELERHEESPSRGKHVGARDQASPTPRFDTSINPGERLSRLNYSDDAIAEPMGATREFLHGRVRNARGEPLPSARVAIHTVAREELDHHERHEARVSADGRFSVRLPTRLRGLFVEAAAEGYLARTCRLLPGTWVGEPVQLALDRPGAIQVTLETISQKAATAGPLALWVVDATGASESVEVAEPDQLVARGLKPGGKTVIVMPLSTDNASAITVVSCSVGEGLTTDVQVVPSSRDAWLRGVVTDQLGFPLLGHEVRLVCVPIESGSPFGSAPAECVGCAYREIAVTVGPGYEASSCGHVRGVRAPVAYVTRTDGNGAFAFRDRGHRGIVVVRSAQGGETLCHVASGAGRVEIVVPHDPERGGRQIPGHRGK